MTLVGTHQLPQTTTTFTNAIPLTLLLRGGGKEMKYKVSLLRYVPPKPGPETVHSRRMAALGYVVVVK